MSEMIKYFQKFLIQALNICSCFLSFTDVNMDYGLSSGTMQRTQPYVDDDVYQIDQ